MQPDRPLTMEIIQEAIDKLQPAKPYVTRITVSLKTYNHIIASNPEKEWGDFLDFSVHILDRISVLHLSDGSVQIGVLE